MHLCVFPLGCFYEMCKFISRVKIYVSVAFSVGGGGEYGDDVDEKHRLRTWLMHYQRDLTQNSPPPLPKEQVLEGFLVFLESRNTRVLCCHERSHDIPPHVTT